MGPPAGVPLDGPRLDGAWARGCAALGFVAWELGLAAHEPWAQGPLRWVLLPDEAFADVPGAEGAGALTVDAAEGDALATPLGLMQDAAELDDTLVHELVHVVQGRLVPGGNGIPWFVHEGMAVSAGARYGRGLHGRATGPVEGYLADASAAEVAEALARSGGEDLTGAVDGPKEAHGLSESAGGLFVEHLRLEFSGAQPRLLAAVSWAGAEGFGAAFSRAFGGLTVVQARDGLLRRVAGTEGDWAARAAGAAFVPGVSPAGDGAPAGQWWGGVE